jgi:hypothetical protein
LLGRCLPATYCTEDNELQMKKLFTASVPGPKRPRGILWFQDDERRGKIVNPAEKNYGCSRD